MSKNVSVEHAESSYIAGGDQHIYNNVPNRSRSSEDFRKLGKRSFGRSTVTVIVLWLLHVHKIDPDESAKCEFKQNTT